MIATFAIDFGGAITEDTTWTLDDSPVRVTSDIRISDDATLTIDAEVEVQLNGHVITSHWPGFPGGYLVATGVVFSGSSGLGENVFLRPDDTVAYAPWLATEATPLSDVPDGRFTRTLAARSSP